MKPQFVQCNAFGLHLVESGLRLLRLTLFDQLRAIRLPKPRKSQANARKAQVTTRKLHVNTTTAQVNIIREPGLRFLRLRFFDTMFGVWGLGCRTPGNHRSVPENHKLIPENQRLKLGNDRSISAESLAFASWVFRSSRS